MSAASVADQISLARQIFIQDKDEASFPPSEPAYRLSSTLLLKTHADLTHREESEKHITKTRKVVVAAGSKHHSNKELGDLRIVPVSGLAVPGINLGKAVALKICSKTYRTSAVHFLAKDENEWMVSISVYHATVPLGKLLLPDGVIRVREPRLKESREGYFIRVDSPADIHLWPTLPSFAPRFTSLLSAEQYRQSGSSHFSNKRYYQAIQAYEAGIFHHANDKAIPLLRLNAAAVYLKIGLPGHALRHLQVCQSTDLTDSQVQKLKYRGSLALYHLERYAEAATLLEDQTYRYPEATEFAELQQKTQIQLAQSQTGEYDWSSLYSAAQNNSSVEMADFVGPVVTKLIEGKGRGLCTARAVVPGELLLVSNPLAVAHPDKKRNNLVLGLNLASESLDTYTQVDIVGTLLEKAGDNEAIAHKLQELFAGPDFPEPLMPGSSSMQERVNGLDAGRIEGICTYNSFRPQCITQGLDVSPQDENENGEHLHSASALYYLPSMINHACIGNATYVFFGDVVVVRATDALAEGEEVLFSYCNAASPLDERHEHLKRYGFTCSCWLCKTDEADSPANLAKRKKLLAVDVPKVSSSSRSTTVRAVSNNVEATYSPSREGPKAELYPVYRLLSRCLEREGLKDEAYDANLKALEALGAVLALPRPVKRSSIAERGLFTTDPMLCLQDAVISCLKLGRDCHTADNEHMARRWFSEAKRLHELEFGPDIFEQRMSRFMKTQGWQSLWTLTNRA